MGWRTATTASSPQLPAEGALGGRLPLRAPSTAKRASVRLSRGLALLAALAASLPASETMALPLAPAEHARNAVAAGATQRLMPVAVFGTDERERLPQRYLNLAGQIGLLHNATTNVICTAFCVGEDLIATASHCLFSRNRGGGLNLAGFVFKQQLPNRSQPQYTHLAGRQNQQTRQFIVTGTSSLNRKPPIGAARDWAVARLERPACRSGWLPTRQIGQAALLEASQAQKIFQVAFHTDFGNWDLAYSRACTINRSYGSLTWPNIKRHFQEPQSLILHSCDTGEASSGSPILFESDQGPVVVGINVGTYQQRDVTVRDGKIIRYSKFRTIANTAVSTSAFATGIERLRQADVLTDNADIRALQSNLRERGFYVGRIDGIYGTSTELAVKAFETENHLPVTGLATRALLEQLVKTALPSVSIDTAEGTRASGTRASGSVPAP